MEYEGQLAEGCGGGGWQFEGEFGCEDDHRGALARFTNCALSATLKISPELHHAGVHPSGDLNPTLLLQRNPAHKPLIIRPGPPHKLLSAVIPQPLPLALQIAAQIVPGVAHLLRRHQELKVDV